MRHRVVTLVCAAFVLYPGPSGAQVAYDSPRGRVEVLGLKRWTLAMLQDSVRRYVPGQELHDAACMVTLRDSLHFAEASVAQFTMAPPGQPARSYLTIKVVEPELAARVQWDLRARNEFSAMLPSYASVVLPITDSTGGLSRRRLYFWLQFPDSAKRHAALLRAPAAARADGERVAVFLASHHGEADRARAMRVLAGDGFWVNRMMATVVLSNFSGQDSTWWALVRALRDPHVGVREAAGMALLGMPSRQVDWRPATVDLRLLLNGTNLTAITDVFNLMAQTAVAADLAPALLRENADWILEHLGSETPMAGDAAHRLLVQLNAGHDLGRTRRAWAAWTRSL